MEEITISKFTRIKNKLKRNKEKVIFILMIIIMSINMFYWIDKKEGWHEDEIFSYGSANSLYENLFHRNSKYDSVTTTIQYKIIKDNFSDILKNIKYYLQHYDEWKQEVLKTSQTFKPVWKSRDDAKEYVCVKEGILNFASVYYNQARDVHPPLFYMLVHIMSSTIFYGNFSKYNIFFINLLFFIGTCIFIKKIMKVLDKENVVNPTVLLYGLSMGAISTVIFQRMYMMLTFFSLMYLYANLKLYKNNFEFDKSISKLLIISVLCGYFTQYYFCIYALFLAIVMFVFMIINKENKIIKIRKIKEYVSRHIILAIIGLIVFPCSIRQIFFSYRGISLLEVKVKYFERLVGFIKEFLSAYSMSGILGIIVILGLIIAIGYKIYNCINGEEKNCIYEYIILIAPFIIYYLVISKAAPMVEIRYIMLTLPVFAILAVYTLDGIIENKIINNIVITVMVLIISIIGLRTQEPLFLFKGYNNHLKIAEENSNLSLIYITDNDFNHILSIQEFMKYNKIKIIYENELDYLRTDKIINNEKEFIVDIRNYLDGEKIINEVLEVTGCSKCELLLKDNVSDYDRGSYIYKISK